MPVTPSLSVGISPSTSPPDAFIVARMKSLLHIMIVVAALLITATALAVDTTDAVGTYELQGVMEMAGGLALKPDHTYEAGFSYGAADWMEEGVWREEGGDIVLSRARFKTKNMVVIQLMLTSGTRFTYKDGRLVATDPARKLVFIDPNRTPSPRNKTGEAGEGRMRVRGKVLKLDDRELVVKTEDCMFFDVNRLSPSVLKAVQGRLGKSIDVEIPYSAIIAGGGCP
jgi:hypothetical protein